MSNNYEKKILWLHVRLTMSELTAIHALCKVKGISVSEMARKALKQAVKR